jgi:hypothetical protein
MTGLDIKFIENQDKAKLDARLEGGNIKPLELKTANVVQGMTGRGRVGIILEMQDENGNKFFAKTTAQLIMNGLAPAARGFCMRVGDNPDMP